MLKMGNPSFRGASQVLITLFCVLAWTAGIDAAPTFSHTRQSNTTISPIDTALRILPLGNSITFGYLSSDGNGYRKALFDNLTANGTSVQMVGSVQAGNMTDNHNEGHPGAIITEIATFANLSLPSRPNIILLMAGTNDMAQSLNISDAPRRLGVLIDQCYAACPDAVILVAQLTPATNNVTQSNVAVFNPTIPDLVSSRVANGTKALIVDMSAFVTTNDLIDGLHPTDGGYHNMAQGWLGGLQEAQEKGWITAPVTVNVTTATGTSSTNSLSASPAGISGSHKMNVSWNLMTGISLVMLLCL